MLPVILFLLFAIIDFGRMFNAQVTLTEAAREGARAVALGHLAGPRVESAAYGLSPLSTTVTACPITPDPGADAVVEVRHSFEFITPVTGLAALFGGGLDGPITLTGRGSCRASAEPPGPALRAPARTPALGLARRRRGRHRRPGLRADHRRGAAGHGRPGGRRRPALRRTRGTAERRRRGRRRRRRAVRP
nr:hypothetical protein GCM10020093_117680 [Planobispora longispora]